MTYTVAALVGVAASVALDLWALGTKLVTRRLFWVSYLVIVGFQLLVNGILTGQRLVVYAPGAILGGATPHLLGHWRVAYAPVEDLLFGFALVLQTLVWWTWWGRSGFANDQPGTPSDRGSDHAE
jgi:lycopene cyclase domain-containing protein